jgi:hypothetical protein
VTDTGVEQARDERSDTPGPWWADPGTWGAVALIVLGGLAAVWVSFRLPGTPDKLAPAYYWAAKSVAFGLVLLGTTLLGHRHARATRGR